MILDKEQIKNDHPSLCFDCVNGRRVAHDNNSKVGWVGCAEYVRRSNDDSFLDIVSESGEGWVDLKSYPLGFKSGIITNSVLVTRGVKKCSAFNAL
jgi:hypothetical protein